MLLLRHLSRPRQYICQQCIRKQHTLARGERPKAKWAAEHPDPAARQLEWEEQAGKIRSGMQQSMLSVLEERGFVKDIAGGRKTLDWLLTEKRIGAYVGVDPTAPSLHVGHLLPLMALYWMYLHGYYTVSLLGGGTVQIGDPSGRTTARSRQGADVQSMNVESIQSQLEKLWTNVKCLGIKHQYAQLTSRRQDILNNRRWLEKLSAVELMRDLGSGMRLGPMLSRDSVKLRMESGEGMAISEFSYPLFQAYDWWSMYNKQGVQLQIGGSDQYGNICAGMDAVSHMRKIHRIDDEAEGDEDPRVATYGLTTPLLTTASGEKFGKSAGNAVWLDRQMLNSFDLYQYFLRTADDDVERYLKLFTFLPLGHIELLMAQQRQDESQRKAQHTLAKEIVELAHGAAEAKKAEMAHRDAFSHGTNTFPLGTLRNTLASIKDIEAPAVEALSKKEQDLHAYKLAYAASSTAPAVSSSTYELPKNDTHHVITLPITLLQAGSFPRVLHAAGLASSKSEAHRLIAKKGAYVVVPNSGSPESPTALKWATIEAGVGVDPNHFLVDWEALVLRSGKSKIQICRIVTEEQFIAEGLTYPGWEETRAT
ncbi:tyrosyl-tRNA synthetase-like protein [Cucurbitaria berberidis CBS 394.84]|uniref:Tyrosine--tRNA ligase n=1 Tax=Cucurbitaria berberidis CBS 394.84 TaxID=1168544 RepID=A0A9P4GA68_9PLEO|nr:tyrosyl-tRNA synthetase-like protein [Cucurbitaria berberidis CBS 394.84]KAF1841877.1 tyrosyl-tRNA synthetase-like protein [Cucurbitaria berberidis CBS 394.84]